MGGERRGERKGVTGDNSVPPLLPTILYGTEGDEEKKINNGPGISRTRAEAGEREREREWEREREKATHDATRR